MRRTTAGLISLALVAGGAAAVAAPAASAAPPEGPAVAPQAQPVQDELPNPLEDKRRALRETALTAVLNGEATPEKRGKSTVVAVDSLEGETQTAEGNGAEKSASQGPDGDKGKSEAVTQYVELERESTDKIFTIITEFGNRRHADFPDKDINPDTEGPATYEGPLHNQIPEPDRSVDNSTNWQADYDRAHYEEIYFGEGESSVASYMETQSSGRYSVEGTVSDWVKVPFNEARYGRSTDVYDVDPNVCAGAVCENTWALVEDGVNRWVRDQRQAGVKPRDIKAMLAEYDVWDRYDHDGDGDFNEPDGYLDHFQIVHAGGDEADGDPQQGEDAIWSHRWYTNATDIGDTGPEGNPLGGAEVGNTGFWVGDYTMQPENGGLSVFVHEYAHDLGIPDLYDTSGGGNNDVEYWSLMAQSRLNDEGEPLGTRPGDLDPWSKLQLGWLDYEIVVAGQQRTIDLGPGQYNTADPQAAVVVLPDKEQTTELGAPAEGEMQWYSGTGDNLANSMSRQVDLTGASDASLTFQGRWNIELNYDYLYAQASVDGGETWTDLDGTVNGEPFPREGSDPAGAPTLHGEQAEWADVVVPMGDYVGQVVDFRFLYRTDGAVQGQNPEAPAGFFADEIVFSADGATVFSDGAEDGDNGWALDGFSAVGASVAEAFDNFYIASKRQYLSYDQYLESGPYNFGFPDRPDFVEHFPYQEGLLVWYWDTSFTDNNTSQHPGGGLNLPIDANPRPIYNLEGQAWRTRIQVYDAPFSLTPDDSFTLHINGTPSYIRGQDAKPTFNDTRKYWFEEMPTHGVKLPATGTRIRVLDDAGDGMKIRIS
ncbi:MAG TPA: immune inhibitor A domain-containing protein [Actinomycetales bacterium]|nr:immune inhibitor A domain-containing protein [Actinomycetales bacterium]